MTLVRVLMKLVKSGDIIITHTGKTMNIEVNDGYVFERDIVNPALLAHMFVLLSPYFVAVDNGTIYNDTIMTTYNYNGKIVKTFE